MMNAKSTWCAGVLAALLLLYLIFVERPTTTGLLWTGSITFGLVALLVVMTARLQFSLGAVLAFVAIVAGVSHLKSQFMSFALHAYDIVVYLGSASTLKFLILHFPRYVFGVCGITLLALAAAIYAFRNETARVDRRLGLAGLVGFAIVAGLTYSSGRPGAFAYLSSRLPLGVFYDSVPAAIDAERRGNVIDALASQPQAPFERQIYCPLKARPPHVILVHEESMFPPEFFPSLAHAPELDPFFRSFDGKLHTLGVEIIGGGSWMTEFSLVAGVSTRSFGTMRSFVGPLMKGKVHDALPQPLLKCGYHNALFYPMDKDFVGDGSFFESIGVDEIIDKAAQSAPSFFERDRFYFSNALKHLEKHIRDDGSKPQFVYIQTMAGHYPYDWAISPGDRTAAGPPGMSAEFNEYLRRQWFAKLDFEAFKAELQRRFPAERFLLVRYGDHQPRITRTLPEAADEANANNSRGRHGLLYRTYYAIEGLNYVPPPLPDVATLDVSYLGAVILQSARLPLDESYHERMRLLRVCKGTYYDCPYRRLILAFHRRLLDSGLISAR